MKTVSCELKNSDSDENIVTNGSLASKVLCSNCFLDLSGYSTKFVCNTCNSKQKTSSQVTYGNIDFSIFLAPIAMQTSES